MRFFGCNTCGVYRGVVTIFGPRDGLSDVRIVVTLSPGAIDVQFHKPYSLSFSRLCATYASAETSEAPGLSIRLGQLATFRGP